MYFHADIVVVFKIAMDTKKLYYFSDSIWRQMLSEKWYNFFVSIAILNTTTMSAWMYIVFKRNFGTLVVKFFELWKINFESSTKFWTYVWVESCTFILCIVSTTIYLKQLQASFKIWKLFQFDQAKKCNLQHVHFVLSIALYSRYNSFDSFVCELNLR